MDEVFVDLSAQIHSILMERYPEISGPPPYDDPTELLPRPPTTALDWNTDAVVDLDESETEDDDPDWDDIVMLIGSEIVRGIRAAILERLKYTCSAGIARNKMIAKLGSAHKKPNQQTIVRNRAVQQFLGGFKFTKIRNLGGKLGDEVAEKFATEQVKDLLSTPIEQMKSRLGDDTGSWVYHIIRGEDSSEVNARTQIKSMLSAKSFRPTINSSDQAVRWLRIFVADIYLRLIEEGLLENKRRPKTINLHHKQGSLMRSRQAPIPTGRSIDEALLFDIAKNILGQIVADGRAWPCSNLQLSVGGFEEGPTGNRGISGFLVRGEEAKAIAASTHGDSHHGSGSEDNQQAKRRRTDDRALPSLFARQNTSHEDAENSTDAAEHSTSDLIKSSSPFQVAKDLSDSEIHKERVDGQRGLKVDGSDKVSQPRTNQSSITSYFCDRCKSLLPAAEKDEHEDWHFARDLQTQDRATPPPIQKPVTKKIGPGRPAATLSAPKRSEKGQSRLVFGK